MALARALHTYCDHAERVAHVDEQLRLMGAQLPIRVQQMAEQSELHARRCVTQGVFATVEGGAWGVHGGGSRSRGKEEGQRGCTPAICLVLRT